MTVLLITAIAVLAYGLAGAAVFRGFPAAFRAARAFRAAASHPSSRHRAGGNRD